MIVVLGGREGDRKKGERGKAHSPGLLSLSYRQTNPTYFNYAYAVSLFIR